jgi:cystathionine beta-lyase
MDFFSLSELSDRTGAKWGRYPKDTIACWIADMDFPVAAPVQAAIDAYVSEGDFGYAALYEQRDAVVVLCDWLSRRHDWSPDPDLGLVVGDVMMGVAGAIQMFTEPGDGIILQVPIYHPFLKAVRTAGRRVVENPLAEDWSVDLEGLAIAAQSASMMLLSHPHNPSGRVFTRAELESIAAIALENDLIVLSDEIHADLVFAPHSHLPLQMVGPEIAARTITMVSASKSFNIAGIGVGVLLFGSRATKEVFEALPSSLLGYPRSIGIEASKGAWIHGAEWLEETKSILGGNRDALRAWVDEADGITMHTPEATYLAWLDFRSWGLDDPATALLDQKVSLSRGLDFGEQGRGYARLNFATSPEIFSEILRRIGSR